MRTALILLALLAAPAYASQTVWKWVDENGVVHYTDRPVPGAERVEISVGSRADALRAAPPRSASGQSTASTESYRNFEILRPSNDETIPNTGGVVDVRVSFEPALQPGHAVYLYLDGKLVEGYSPTTQEFTLQDIPRGTHTLVAVIQDQRGRRLQQTPTVHFTVRQTSIAQPPVGPALRPPPKRPTQPGNKLSSTQPSYTDLNGTRNTIDPRTNLPVQKK